MAPRTRDEGTNESHSAIWLMLDLIARLMSDVGNAPRSPTTRRQAQQQSSAGTRSHQHESMRGESSRQVSEQVQDGHGSPSRRRHRTHSSTSVADRPSRRTRASPIQFAATFDNQPPKEIRPDQALPPIRVRLQVAGSIGPTPVPSPFDPQGDFHAIGTVASLNPSPGEGEQTTATAPEHHTMVGGDTQWTFVLRPNGVPATGYYRLEVILMFVPRRALGATRTEDSLQLMSILSRPFYVHSFAPLIPG